MKSMSALLLVLVLSCSGISGKPPTRDEFDPRGLHPGPPQGATLIDSPESERILEQYAMKFSEGFPIYPGDEIRFAVSGQPELSFDIKVPIEGAIHYPLIGNLALAGRSIEAVRREVRSRLEETYLVAPQVTAQVRTYAPKRVFVLGAVVHPREVDVTGGSMTTLLQAVTQAGGFLDDASRHGVIVYRPREVGSTARLALLVDAIAIQDGRGRDPSLLPDDVVFVPTREKIYVLGQVAHPGAFVVPADRELTATQAIALAGGYTRLAKEDNVRLVRRDRKGGKRTHVLNLARVVGGHASEDVPLQPGDVLFVPESVF